MSKALDTLEARLGYWRDKGALERVPSPWQIKAGWFAMLPVTLSESNREREQSRKTLMGQVPIRVPLQILFNPRQVLVDTGLHQTKEQLIKHVVSVFHEPAFLGYDLQLLESFPGGLDLLAERASDIVAGKGLWSGYLKKLTGGNDYHARLVQLADDASHGRYPDPLDIDPRFASLTGFAKFCLTLPDWPAEKGFYGFDFSRW